MHNNRLIPRFTVITVTYNAASVLEDTIQSVISQTYHHLEYIIIDGASTDDTLGIAKRFNEHITHVVSEPDRGLYDAMNKGLALATGDYLCFLNAGDSFHEDDTLQQVVHSLQAKELPDVIYGETALVDAKGHFLRMRTGMETIRDKSVEKKYGANKTAGEKFLAENKTKAGVVTTPSGLQYKVITKGTGAIPADTCKVKVNYKGTLIDGTEFDSSYKRKEPATFRVNQVIKGWTEALKLMPVGSKWELYVPYELAYGSRETGGQIKPFSTLIFEIELLSIEK